MSQSQGGMGGILPLLIAAGGVYLIIKNTKLPAPVGVAPGDGAAPPVGTTLPNPAPTLPAPAPPVSTPNQPTAATAPAPVNDLEAIARRAAAGNAEAVAQAVQLGILYNSDQWNWMRAAGGGGQTTADLFPPGDRNYRMNVNEYLSRRNAAGLGSTGRGWRRSR